MVNFPEAEEILSSYLATSTIIFVNPMVKSLKKVNCTRLMFVWKGILASNGAPLDILKDKNSFFVKKYLPIYEDRVKERVENIRQRSTSRVLSKD
jgi:hypothetical protein